MEEIERSVCQAILVSYNYHRYPKKVGFLDSRMLPALKHPERKSPSYIVEPLVKRMHRVTKIEPEPSPDLLNRYIYYLCRDKHAFGSLGKAILHAPNHD